MPDVEVELGALAEIEDPGCREFEIGDGDWPFKGFVVRKGDQVFAYQNYCTHAGHPLNWAPDRFLTKDRSEIICASHGAVYGIEDGECRGGPCRDKALRKVQVEIRDGVVFVAGPNSM